MTAPDVPALVDAAFPDGAPSTPPEPERLPADPHVDGAPTLPDGRVVGAYRSRMTPQQEADEREREHDALMADIARARAACERMMARPVQPRNVAPPDPLANARASVAELRTAAETGKRADVLAALTKVEESLR